MNITIVPKNYQHLLKQVAGKQTGTDDEGNAVFQKPEHTFLSFTRYTTPEIEYLGKWVNKLDTPYNFKKSKERETYKFLYPNAEITESISHSYTQDSSTYATAVNGMLTGGTSLVNAMVQFGTQNKMGAIYDAPYMWTSTERREFTITLNLFAYTDLYADIYEPIEWFRKNSYPRRATLNDKQWEEGKKEILSTPVVGSMINGIDIIGKYITGDKDWMDETVRKLGVVSYPSVFKIEGGAFETFNARKDLSFFVLKGMNVTYSDGIKLLKGGLPMNARVTLTFQECIKLYKDLFELKEIDVTVTEQLQKVTPALIGRTTGPEGIDKNTLSAKVNSYAVGLVKSTSIYRTFSNVQNLQNRIINEAIGYAMKKIQGSKLYKRVNDALNIDIMHRIEMRKYLTRGAQANYKTQEHVREDVSPVLTQPTVVRKNEITKTEPQHELEILKILRKTK